MKKTVKMLSILLSLCLLAACGGGSGDPATDSNLSPEALKDAKSSSPSDINNSPVTPGISGVINRDLRDETAPLTFEIDGAEETVDARLVTGEFDNGIFFSLYMDAALYEESASNGKFYYSAKNAPGGAYLEIGYVEGTDNDKLAPSLLESYDEIKSLNDNGDTTLGTLPVRHVSAVGAGSVLEAYLIQGGSGVLTIVVSTSPEDSEGHGERLTAMAATLIPE